MSKNNTVKKNIIYQVSYELLIILIPFITSPYLARTIGAEGVGVYSFSYSVALYFVLFAMLGVKNYGNRSIAKVDDDANERNLVFSSILIMHIITSLVCVLFYGIYILYFANDKIYAIIQVPYVLSAIFDISWFYFGIGNNKVPVFSNAIVRLFSMASIFIFVQSSNDLWKYCLIMSLSHLFCQIPLWLPLHKYVRLVRVDYKEIVIHFRPMLILFIPVIAVSLYKYMDKIMIGLYSSKQQLGFYENAEKINSIPSAIITAVGTVMMPKMTSLIAKKQTDKSVKYMEVSVEFLMCLAFAMAGGIASVGKNFAMLFLGADFSVSGDIIMLLSVTIPFIAFANIIRTQYLIPNQKDKEYLSSVIIGAVVNLFINYLFIPRFGAIGAAIGTISAEITVCIVQMIIVRNEIPLNLYFRKTVFFVVPCLVMFISVFSTYSWRGGGVLTLFIQISMGIVVYFIISLLYFILTKNEIVKVLLKKICLIKK